MLEPIQVATLVSRLRAALNAIRILPRRLLLATPGVEATVPMLRGVWGAVLHEVDRAAYDRVFDPQTARGEMASPLYLLRPAPAEPEFAPAIEWISLGPALDCDDVLWRAWRLAAEKGLGPQRRPFRIRRCLVLDARGLAVGEESIGNPGGSSAAWPLGEALWPPAEAAEAAATPCRLLFPGPLRLRRHGRLIESPTLPDLVVAACRRVGALLPPAEQAAWQELSGIALAVAREQPAAVWRGQRLDLHRYSARQQAELELHGVCGWLDLPQGPGPVWPLLAAARWLHLGKATALGLGQLLATPLPEET